MDEIAIKVETPRDPEPGKKVKTFPRQWFNDDKGSRLTYEAVAQRPANLRPRKVSFDVCSIEVLANVC